MPSVLLLAVNRHQESYFQELAQSSEHLGITALHKNNLPKFPSSWAIPVQDKKALADIVRYCLATEAQELPGYRLTGLRRLWLTLKYTLAVRLFYLRVKQFFTKNQFDLIGLWNGMKWHQKIIRLLIKPEVRTLFFENGAFPDTTTADPKGVNFGSSIPTNPDFYRSHTDGNPVKLPENLIVREGKKRKAGTSDQPLPDRYIFVPFQVDSDTQIVEYSPWIRNMEMLYQLLSEITQISDKEPPVFVVKEHPSSANDYRHLHELNSNIRFYNQTNTQTLIEGADCILTINSSVGFEALLLNKPVITLGQAFYALPGLVSAANTAESATSACQNHHFPDQNLREAFLNYLYSDYYVKGSWCEAEQHHLNTMLGRIEQTLKLS